MFELLGDKPDAALVEAQSVMRIETSLAKGPMTRVERRDPKALDHKMPSAELANLSPAFPWQIYFTKVGMPILSSLNVSAPAFVKTMNDTIEKESLAAWKTYLRWHLVHANAAHLSSPFLNETFAFYGNTLHRQQRFKPPRKPSTHNVHTSPP